MKRNLMLKSKQNAGFTLVEFLVASALSMIVITAAGGTYLITRQLNSNAQRRLDVQQNLRNAASLVTRDARNTGSFGCYSTSSSGTSNFPRIENGATRQLELDTTKNDGYGVRLISQQQAQRAGFNLTNITFKGDAIAFIYGKGSAEVVDSISRDSSNNYTLNTIKVGNYSNDPDLQQTVKQKGDLVVSSCLAAVTAKPTGSDSNSITFASKQANALGSGDSNGISAELIVSKYYGAAYVVGWVNGVSSLLRYDLDASGKWQGPQLLAQNVQSLTPTFGYVEGCGNDLTTTLNKEHFVFSDKLNKNALPTIVRLNLKYNYPDSTTDIDYIINATIRSGNSCAGIFSS
ncbi:PilW family protein [Kingella negevensis]|uniref:PilW family protein n=1 Tax=Kingella negevensis TaxID=1522312 RepID=UPI00254F50B2|nr:prepilin-type N-terminal cleavage/methylation domain-containing protein [Kingella negevensis]MDK4680740.1 prepilin-type N-terminal cleavage/methylation domain-containing protein [Kingella negevensis]MDK4681537.1 prepilin-type N-terminal cleavage/methylation domain-containing protein [Kingella negevensis]MDK4691924.1 prepilin-type N-terminal cleavage/methylation domain-containing protein [Kingella negevensis]MDK4692923.1 prepilin-type N-terminal cleavage/methylation domain-containing protein 